MRRMVSLINKPNPEVSDFHPGLLVHDRSCWWPDEGPAPENPSLVRRFSSGDRASRSSGLLLRASPSERLAEDVGGPGRGIHRGVELIAILEVAHGPLVDPGALGC